ncbi:MAG: prolipoprotein diacylglyceryl transferase family protein [Verrucomicrobiota bacterium]
MAYSPSTAYGFLMLIGIGVTLVFWSRLARRDDRLLLIYIAGLTGAFLGAKIVYLSAEGWLFLGVPDRWMIWATGKSILGALLGGYGAVEIAKKCTGYQGVTGDWFAMIVPIGVMIGRIGCLLHGCCTGRKCRTSWYTMRDTFGVPRWPAVPVEMIFNALMIALFFGLRRTRKLSGQHFHLYLIGYGLFRFAHEFMRETPRVAGVFSGYQIASLAVVALGVVGFVRRARLPRCI